MNCDRTFFGKKYDLQTLCIFLQKEIFDPLQKL